MIGRLPEYSPDLTAKNIDALAELFPAVVTEALSANRAIRTSTSSPAIGAPLTSMRCGRSCRVIEDSVRPETIRETAARQPLRAVFRDSGFDTDAARINAEQIFRELSSPTDVKTI